MISEIICSEIAFRLSGRFSVIFASGAGIFQQEESDSSLQKSSFCGFWLLGIFPADVVAQLNEFYKLDESIPGSAPTLRRAARTASVGMLPTRSSPAKGQPPSPVSALSKRRQPAA